MSKDLTHKLNGSQDEKLDRIISAVQRMETELSSVSTRLDSLETKVEERLKDTRPMWEAVQGQLTELRSEVKADLGELRSEVKADLGELRSEVKSDLVELRSEVKADLGELRTEFKADLEKLRNEMEKGFRRLGHKIALHAHTVEDLHGDLRDHEERLDKLEKIES
ncbi:MAG: hypothetical protein AABN33_26710 [Acidobacteriota bacterium]